MRFRYALVLLVTLPLFGAGPIPVLVSAAPGLSVCDTNGCGPRGARLISGPRGGCYYVNSRGNREYVDRDCCR